MPTWMAEVDGVAWMMWLRWMWMSWMMYVDELDDVDEVRWSSSYRQDRSVPLCHWADLQLLDRCPQSPLQCSNQRTKIEINYRMNKWLLCSESRMEKERKSWSVKIEVFLWWNDKYERRRKENKYLRELHFRVNSNQSESLFVAFYYKRSENKQNKLSPKKYIKE